MVPAKNDDHPVRGWRIAFLVACTVGICLSADLLRLHVNVHTDPNYQSYCAISERVNCDTLALSKYAVFAGLPLSVWGLFGYLLMAGLAVWGLGRRPEPPSWPFGIAFWLSAFSAAVAVPLFLIAHFVVQSVCVVCAGTYLVSFLLVFFAWRALRRVGAPPWAAVGVELRALARRPLPFTIFSGVLALLLLLAWLTIPPYWRVEAGTASDLPTGTTEDGHPWIGGRTPLLSIVEFSDYQCPHCQRGHHDLRELITAYPNEVRLVHRNYPLDHHCNHALDRRFHPNACLYARMAVCAAEQDRFWPANDYLFREGRRTTPVGEDELAKAAGLDRGKLVACLNSAAAKRSVEEDLRVGRDLGVRGTPTFVIGKEVFPGRIPPEILAGVLGIDTNAESSSDEE